MHHVFKYLQTTYTTFDVSTTELANYIILVNICGNVVCMSRHVFPSLEQLARNKRKILQNVLYPAVIESPAVETTVRPSGVNTSPRATLTMIGRGNNC